VLAQSTTPKTSQVTQQLIDQVVNAISDAVVEKLKKDGTLVAKPAEPVAAPAKNDDHDVVAESVAEFSTKAETALRAFPELGMSLARIPTLLDESGNGGHGLGIFVVMMVVVVGAALAAEQMLRVALTGIRNRLAAQIVHTKGFWPFFVL